MSRPSPAAMPRKVSRRTVSSLMTRRAPRQRGSGPQIPALRGTVQLPGSKSITNRALLLSALSAAGGTSRLNGALRSDDTEDTALIAGMLGCDVQWGPCTAEISRSCGEAPNSARISGSATAVRLGAAALAVRGPHDRFCLSLSDQLSVRPLLGGRDSGFRKALRDMTGMDIRQEGGRVIGVREAPMPRHAERPVIHTRADRSSQNVSSLMTAGALLGNGVELRVESWTESVSSAYIYMTAAVMRSFGADADVSRLLSDGVVTVKPGGYRPNKHYDVETDASAASYPMTAAAITPDSDVTVGMAAASSIQGDAVFAEHLADMGARVDRADDSVRIQAPHDAGLLKGLGEVDMRGTPDLVQSLAVAASFADSPTVMSGIGFLADKETNRIDCTAAEINKLTDVIGVRAVAGRDSLEVTPDPIMLEAHRGSRFGGTAVLDAHGDHRMEMALSLMSLRAPGVTVAGAGCCSKSWPEYHDTMRGLATAGRRD